MGIRRKSKSWTSSYKAYDISDLIWDTTGSAWVMLSPWYGGREKGKDKHLLTLIQAIAGKAFLWLRETPEIISGYRHYLHLRDAADARMRIVMLIVLPDIFSMEIWIQERWPLSPFILYCTASLNIFTEFAEPVNFRDKTLVPGFGSTVNSFRKLLLSSYCMPEVVLAAEASPGTWIYHCVLSTAPESQALPFLSKCDQHIKIQ